MLKLPRHFHLELPHLPAASSRPLQFSPATEDNDELLQAVQTDPDDHDDNWELTDRVDEGELDEFWNSVEKAIANDPSRASFED